MRYISVNRFPRGVLLLVVEMGAPPCERSEPGGESFLEGRPRPRGWRRRVPPSLNSSFQGTRGQSRKTRTLLEAMRAAPQNGVRVSPTHPLLSRAWPRNVWHPSAHWETSRIAAKFIGPRAARYGRSRPLLTLAPFTALRTRVRVKKKQ